MPAFHTSIAFDDPELEPLRGKSISEDLPEVLVAPYAILNAILTGKGVDHGQTEPDPLPPEEEESTPATKADPPGKTTSESPGPGDGSKSGTSLEEEAETRQEALPPTESAAGISP